MFFLSSNRENQFYLFVFESVILKCKRTLNGHIVNYHLVDKVPFSLIMMRHQVSGNSFDSIIISFFHFFSSFFLSAKNLTIL